MMRRLLKALRFPRRSEHRQRVRELECETARLEREIVFHDIMMASRDVQIRSLEHHIETLGLIGDVRADFSAMRAELLRQRIAALEDEAESG